MASVEIGKNIPVVTAPPVASNRAAANQSVLPSIRQAAEQFADAKSATVRQITDSAEKVHKALDAINAKLHQSSTSLAFSVDSDSQRMVIRVTDQESGEVLFTFPHKINKSIMGCTSRVASTTSKRSRRCGVGGGSSSDHLKLLWECVSLIGKPRIGV